MNFSDILVQKKLISQDKLAQLLTKSQDSKISLEKFLKTEGVSEEEIIRAKGEAIGVPTQAVSKEKIPFEILKQIPEEAARHYKFAPLAIKDGVLEIGMVDYNNIESREALQFIMSRLNMPFKIFLISEKDLDIVLGGYKGLHGEVTKVLGELESALSDTFKDVGEAAFKTETKFVEEAPITKIVAVVLKHAISGNASDIHIEPLRENLRVRFRVDGILYTSLILPVSVHDAVVARIKVLTGSMKLDEKRKPQDGRFEARIDGKEIDFRVSTFPTFFGEKVVIRILDKTKGLRSLNDLGFSDGQRKIIRECLKKPYGLILLTGPTGSGKTTSLYAMLQELDREKANVVSLEDPVEYNIEGINQSQVRPEIGYDFANGLRSILRQDPNMIMVGEIRDKETASLAIQAALTGHMVFSTLHTNNSAGVIPRLIDMGVDPFLIAPTILLVIAQRLVRTLCPDSRKLVSVSGIVRDKVNTVLESMPKDIKQGIKMPDNVYQGIPSATCPEGAKGRVGVYELFYKTPELENIILTNPVEPEVLKEARNQGMLTVQEDAMLKMFNGIIGADEFNRL